MQPQPDATIDTLEEYVAELSFAMQLDRAMSYHERLGVLPARRIAKTHEQVIWEESRDFLDQVFHFQKTGAPNNVVDSNIKRAWRDRTECQNWHIVDAED